MENVSFSGVPISNTIGYNIHTNTQDITFFGTAKTWVHEIRRPVCVQGSLPEYFAYHIEHFSKNFKT